MTIQIANAYTLADITPQPQMIRVRDSNKIEYHQQQNYHVLLQTIGLRTQVIDPTITRYTGNPNEWQFSEFYDNYESINVWRLQFGFETPDVWKDGNDELALLKEDAHGVAFTADLDDNVDFLSNVFDTKVNTNLYFMIT